MSVLEMRLEEIFNDPTMWEPLEIAVMLTCLESIKFLEKR
jgi:hypothetical protein